jgi:hypothetical protein
MVPYSAVVVWELRGLIEDVRCFFVPRASGYVLSIERAGEHLLEELHDDFREMMSRARELRSSLVRVGFEPVSADASTTSPLDSMLLDFVRAGTAPLTSLSHRPS